MMNRNSTDHRREVPSGPQGPFEPGDYYSFRTAPLTKYSEPETDRYAAVKILAVDDVVTFVVLDGVWSYRPNLSEALKQTTLCNERFLSGGKPALHYVPIDWDVDLLEFHHLGNRPVSEDELSLIPKLRGYGSWSTASSDAEGEWRWHHDRERVRLEVERGDADQKTKQIEAQRRYESRLKHLTWAKLRDEQAFSRWRESPPFPPVEFANAARTRVQRAIDELEALGSKPKKKDVRAILRSCVEWFNAEDTHFGEVIETEEREDICEVIGELALVAGHRGLSNEVDEWRTW